MIVIQNTENSKFDVDDDDDEESFSMVDQTVAFKWCEK